MSLYYNPLLATVAGSSDFVDDDAIEDFWGHGWGLTSPTGLPPAVVAPTTMLPSFDDEFGEYANPYRSLYYPTMTYGYGWRGWYSDDDFSDYYGGWCGYDDDDFDDGHMHIMRRRSF